MYHEPKLKSIKERKYCVISNIFWKRSSMKMVSAKTILENRGIVLKQTVKLFWLHHRNQGSKFELQTRFFQVSLKFAQKMIFRTRVLAWSRIQWFGQTSRNWKLREIKYWWGRYTALFKRNGTDPPRSVQWHFNRTKRLEEFSWPGKLEGVWRYCTQERFTKTISFRNNQWQYDSLYMKYGLILW